MLVMVVEEEEVMVMEEEEEYADGDKDVIGMRRRMIES